MTGARVAAPGFAVTLLVTTADLVASGPQIQAHATEAVAGFRRTHLIAVPIHIAQLAAVIASPRAP